MKRKGKPLYRCTCLTILAAGWVLCLFLAGCKTDSMGELLPTQDPPQIPAAFSCEIDFSMEGLAGAAHLERPGRSEELQDPSAAPLDAGKGMELCFSAPDTLSGVAILYLDGLARIQIDGVEADFFTYPQENGAVLPDGALISVLAGAVDRAASSQQEKECWSRNGQEEWMFSGNLLDGPAPELGNFRLTVSGDGLPVSLDAENVGISVQFSQVTVISDSDSKDEQP